MRMEPRVPVLVVCVDVGFRGEPAVDGVDLLETAHRVLATCKERGWSLTWAFERPAASARIVEMTRPESGRHEIALLAHSSADSKPVGRADFAARLAASLHEAQSLGSSPRTVCFPSDPGAEHLDLLGKRGITAVRVANSFAMKGHVARENQGVAALRYGVWGFAVAPAFAGLQEGELEVGADRVRVLAFDLARLADGTSVQADIWERLLSRTSELGAINGTIVESLAGAVARISRRRETTAHSILRPRAA